MLCITRRINEGFAIGPDVYVRLLRTGNTVTLAIDAPDDVEVLRDEILLREHPDHPVAAVIAESQRLDEEKRDRRNQAREAYRQQKAEARR